MMSHRVRRLRRPRLSTLVAIVLALSGAALLSACGSSSKGSSGSSGSSGASSSTASAGNSGSSGATGSSGSGVASTVPANVAEAKAAVQKLLVRPTALSIPTLPSKPPTGKTIDFIACGVPACQDYIPLLRAATDAVGWNLKINSGVTPQSISAAYDQAVRDRPAGVIGSGGNPPSLFARQLSQLKAEGVPVVLQVVPPSSTPGITAIVLNAQDNAEDGQEMANEMLAQSGGKDVHVAIMHSPGTPIYANADEAISKTMSSSACQSCSASTLTFPETAIGTSLPSLVTTYLRSHPQVNYLFFDFTNEVDGVPTALSQAGLGGKVKILTIDINSTEAAYMRNGQELAAAGNPWPEVLWTELNIIIRDQMHLPLGPAENVKLPNMILTKANLINSNGQAYFPLVADYQAIFKKAWHVS